MALSYLGERPSGRERRANEIATHLVCKGHARYALCIEDAMKTLAHERVREAKSIVALAFRKAPIEDVHAGKVCPVCSSSPDYSQRTEDEMKAMIKSAVNAVYKLLWNRDHDSEAYAGVPELLNHVACSCSAAIFVFR